VQIEGIDPGALYNHLWTKHRIITSPIKTPEMEGVRVTPNVYTTLEEIDVFIDAMERVARNGLPA
jgi:isopenicillin-N epimerase